MVTKMLKRKPRRHCGFTLTEVMVVIVITLIFILSLGTVLVDAHRGWGIMYRRVNGEVVTGGYIARRTFDSMVRKGCKENVSLGPLSKWCEIQYYSNEITTVADCYTLFYVLEGNLKVEQGIVDPRAELSTRTVCGNVTNCTFSEIGDSVRMVLELDDGTNSRAVVSSAVMHN